MTALSLETRKPYAIETSAHALFQLSESMEKKITLSAKPAGAFVLATPLLFSTAPAVTQNFNQYSFFNHGVPHYERAKPLAEEVAAFLTRFEERVFAYPGTVVDIEKNISGDAKNVVISVSIHGKSHMVKKSVSQLSFEVQPNMPLVVEGIKRGSAKKLNIKKAEPVSLSNIDLELLKSL